MATSSRGGARRAKPPELCEDALFRAFSLHLPQLSHLGAYETIEREGQPSGKGLLHLSGLIASLLALAPGAETQPMALRKCFQKHGVAAPQLNKSEYSLNIWCGLRQERVTTVLNHVRRLKREPEKFRQVCLKLTGTQIADLENLLRLVDPAVQGGLSASELLATAAQEVAETETLYFPEVPSAGELLPGRKLARHVSDASVDSQGWPKMLKAATEEEEPQQTARSSSSKRRFLTLGAHLQGRSSAGSPPPPPPPPAPKAQAKEKSSSPPVSLSRAEGSPQAGSVPKAKAKAKAKLAESPGVKRKAEQAEEPQLYSIMYYKQGNSFAFRKRYEAKNQIFTISNKSWSKEQLQELAEATQLRLEAANMNWEPVMAWAKEQLRK